MRHLDGRRNKNINNLETMADDVKTIFSMSAREEQVCKSAVLVVAMTAAAAAAV